MGRGGMLEPGKQTCLPCSLLRRNPEHLPKGPRRGQRMSTQPETRLGLRGGEGSSCLASGKARPQGITRSSSSFCEAKCWSSPALTIRKLKSKEVE